MNITESFVYKWTNIETKRAYIGKHKGKPDDGYISSSRLFLDAYYKAPHLFFREILHFGPDVLMLPLEQKLIGIHFKKYGYKGSYNRIPAELEQISMRIDLLMEEQQKECVSEVGAELRELRRKKKVFIKEFYK